MTELAMIAGMIPWQWRSAKESEENWRLLVRAFLVGLFAATLGPLVLYHSLRLSLRKTVILTLSAVSRSGRCL